MGVICQETPLSRGVLPYSATIAARKNIITSL